MGDGVATPRIGTLTIGGGRLGLTALPGRDGAVETDMRAVLAWRPDIVVSLTEMSEMARFGAASLPDRLAAAQVDWAHLPICDYDAPAHDDPRWPALGAKLHGVLENDGGVLLHCFAGRGRSGAIALRLMVERGEDPSAALRRLRAVRSGAVETEAQRLWAIAGAPSGLVG